MKYKAVVCDLDGTLLNNEHKLSDYTKKIINEVLKRDIPVIIATGRHHLDALKIRDSLGLATTLISSNGARVHDELAKEIIANDLQEQMVKELLQLQVEKEIYRNIYQGDKWLVEKENDRLKEYHTESGFRYDLANFNNIEPLGVQKVFYITEKDNAKKLIDIQSEITRVFSDRLNITFSVLNCLEIMDRNVSKGSALRQVLKKYNIDSKEVIAFGDGLNDLEMLEYVGKGVLMGNADIKLKEKLSNNEIALRNIDDGVAKYLVNLL